MISGRVERRLYEHEVPVMARDDDSTRPRLFAFLDKIRLGETLSLVCRLELLSKVVVTHATGIDD